MTPQAPAAAAIPGGMPAEAPDADDDEAQEDVVISCLPDGSYTVAGKDGQPQPAATVKDVLKLVQQALDDSQGAWAAEAQGRDGSGMRQPAGAPAMSM